MASAPPTPGRKDDPRGGRGAGTRATVAGVRCTSGLTSAGIGITSLTRRPVTSSCDPLLDVLGCDWIGERSGAPPACPCVFVFVVVFVAPEEPDAPPEPEPPEPEPEPLVLGVVAAGVVCVPCEAGFVVPFPFEPLSCRPPPEPPKLLPPGPRWSGCGWDAVAGSGSWARSQLCSSGSSGSSASAVRQ